MSTYSIDGHKERRDFEGTAAEAVRKAALNCYLPPHQTAEHAERLQETGRTAWAYGFSSVVVTLEAL